MGTRIRQARGKLWTRQQLADAVECSPSTIKKLEHGDRQPSLSLLHRIAEVLNVRVAWLAGGPLVAEAAPDMAAVRAVLTPIAAANAEPIAPERAQGAVDYLFALYWGARFHEFIALAPEIIEGLRAALRDRPSPRLHEFVARVLWPLGIVATRVGFPAEGLLAGSGAREHASLSEDPLLVAAVEVGFAHSLQIDGRDDDSAATVLRATRGIEPQGTVTTEQLGMYSGMLTISATVTAAAGRLSEAEDLLDEGRLAAERIGHDRIDYQIPSGPSMHLMMATTSYVNAGDYDRALKEATRIRDRSLWGATGRSVLLSERALAEARTGKYTAALETLKELEIIAPECLDEPLPRLVLTELIDRTWTNFRRSDLIRLSQRVGHLDI
ncbi:helix-turn-helix transcriptional regulator [Sciscionella sediminilitoris]|uniref:helix-turn-helix transcriptional regulator n=1 Tax=Sciscionella sediminilitoris TaxID=1445613 RepID=UPI0018D0E040|nr:helix-turn-helix transcriptional regulator [Sciscionella sp. SE31]